MKLLLVLVIVSIVFLVALIFLSFRKNKPDKNRSRIKTEKVPRERIRKEKTRVEKIIVYKSGKKSESSDNFERNIMIFAFSLILVCIVIPVILMHTLR